MVFPLVMTRRLVAANTTHASGHLRERPAGSFSLTGRLVVGERVPSLRNDDVPTSPRRRNRLPAQPPHRRYESTTA